MRFWGGGFSKMFHSVVFCNSKMCLEECSGLSTVLRGSFEDISKKYSGNIIFIGALAEVFGMVFLDY